MGPSDEVAVVGEKATLAFAPQARCSTAALLEDAGGGAAQVASKETGEEKASASFANGLLTRTAQTVPQPSALRLPTAVAAAGVQPGRPRVKKVSWLHGLVTQEIEPLASASDDESRSSGEAQLHLRASTRKGTGVFSSREGATLKQQRRSEEHEGSSGFGSSSDEEDSQLEKLAYLAAENMRINQAATKPCNLPQPSLTKQRSNSSFGTSSSSEEERTTKATYPPTPAARASGAAISFATEEPRSHASSFASSTDEEEVEASSASAAAAAAAAAASSRAVPTPGTGAGASMPGARAGTAAGLALAAEGRRLASRSSFADSSDEEDDGHRAT